MLFATNLANQLRAAGLSLIVRIFRAIFRAWVLLLLVPPLIRRHRRAWSKFLTTPTRSPLDFLGARAGRLLQDQKIRQGS